MDRPRYRRRDPYRTGPIRNAGGALRDGDPWRDAERRGGDAASRGVREGYRLIEEQIRRGRRIAQSLEDEDDRGSAHYRRRDERRPGARREEEDWDERRERRGGFHFLAGQMRRTERLAREILRQIGSGRPDPWRLAELVFRLYIESASDFALLGLDALGVLTPRREDRFEEDVDRIERDVEDSFEDSFEEIEEEDEEDEYEEEPWEWPAAPSVPTVVRASVPLPVWVWTHERAEVDLDLPAGAQSLDLEVEPLRAAGTDRPPHPAFEAVFVRIAHGLVILRVEVPRELPAGRYVRRVLVRATGEPVGTLSVQIGAIPAEGEP